MAAETDDAREKREFAAWKFNAIELLNIGLGHREFRVAVCLLDHMNGKTRLVRPSQYRVARLLNMDESAVRRAIRVLVSIGLLNVDRQNRQSTNHYSFSTVKLNEFYDLRADRLALLRNPDREKVSAQDCDDEEEAPGREQEETPHPDREDMSAKLLNGTIDGNHQDSATIEDGYRLDSSGTVPREEGDGEASPQGERAGGAFRAHGTVTSAFLNSDIMKSARVAGRSPQDSLDQLDRANRTKWATDPLYRGVQ